MAYANHPIAAVSKPKQGKGPARELRRQGYIPAIIYGHEKEAPLPLGIKLYDLEKALRVGHFYTHKQELVVDGKTLPVLAREIQRHPVTDIPTHIDFMAYNPSRRIHTNVMVMVVGQAECKGLKNGGVIQLVESTIEVICRADSIPEQIEVSIAGLDIGDTVHLSEVSMPEGVKAAVIDRDLTILSLISTRTAAMEEEEKKAAEDAAAAAAAAGGVVAGAPAAAGAKPAAGAAAPAAAAGAKAAAPAAAAKPAAKK
ncbi:MAG: 50S ribosomal protein L25/general stress protein Ctc [Alphaproteobacteria bacterium]